MRGRPGTAPVPRPGKGFTLVELLVVMALLGLTVAVVIPNITTAYDKIKFKGETKKLLEIVKRCRFQAFFNQKNVVLSEKNSRLVIEGLDLEEGKIPDLRCRLKDEIQFAANGVSTGGEILILFKDKPAARIVVRDFSGQAALESL